MLRQEYLRLCREISLLPDGSGGILSRPPPELLVIYDGTVYYPLYYEMRFKKGKYYDMAALHSLKANSICFVPLKDLKPYLPSTTNA